MLRSSIVPRKQQQTSKQSQELEKTLRDAAITAAIDNIIKLRNENHGKTPQGAMRDAEERVRTVSGGG